LKSTSKGEARKVVAHLLLGSAENCDAAWELLTKRYEDHRKIFSILNIDSFKQIKHFIDTTNEAIHILKLKTNLTDEVDVLLAVKLLSNMANHFNFKQVSYSNWAEKCPICKMMGHFATQCRRFRGMNPAERMEIA